MTDQTEKIRKPTREAVIAEMTVRIMECACRILIAVYAVGFAAWYATANGLKDRSGTPLGADFLDVYAAGLMIRRGQAAMAYDWNAHHQVEQAVSGYASPYYGWHYPPMFMIVAALTACAPYLWSFTLYMAAGFVGYLAALRRIAPRTRISLWVITAFPGVFCNIINGQNGFITTALFGAGCLQLEQNPWLAGIFFGLLAYKPQFFVVIPLVLAISGYGRAFMATTATALTSAALSWALFGSSAWLAFFNSTKLTRHIILEQGSTGWKKIQSVFSLARMWGGDIETAYAVQTAVAVAAIALTIWIWRKQTTPAVRVAALCGGILLTTPYVLDYDLVILAVPIAFLARQGLETGFRAYEKPVLALLWILPLLARGLGGFHILVAPFLVAALMGLCLLRAQQTNDAEFRA